MTKNPSRRFRLPFTRKTTTPADTANSAQPDRRETPNRHSVDPYAHIPDGKDTKTDDIILK